MSSLYDIFKKREDSFRHVVSTSFDAAAIRNIVANMGSQHATTKQERIQWIEGIMRTTSYIEQHYIDKVVKIQRWWRNRGMPVFRGPWPHVPAVNTEDVFTLEDLMSFPQSHIFSYKDSAGEVYAFYAPELYYAIHANIRQNPYTREEIPATVIARLERMMKHIPKKHVAPLEELWTSTDNAYGHVLGVLEREHGIYCQVEWLSALTKAKIIRVFYEFHQNCAIPTLHFDLDKLYQKKKTNHKFVFAREILRLLQDRDEPHLLYLICNLLFTLSQHSKDIRSNLPSWVMLGAASFNTIG